MRQSEILIKPIVSEKSNRLSEERNTYAFRVSRKANKLEIKQAVEAFYNVKVEDVHTMVVPRKAKNRMTKAGYIQGSKPAYKKAYVTVAEGETIDFYGAV
ncbi:MAG: 50S ribosomal protein L23 [Lacibacter sp.]